MYNLDLIVANTASLAELLGKLEHWRTLLDRGVQGCPPSLQQNVQLLSNQWRDLVEAVRGSKNMLKKAHDNVTLVSSWAFEMGQFLDTEFGNGTNLWDINLEYECIPLSRLSGN